MKLGSLAFILQILCLLLSLETIFPSILPSTCFPSKAFCFPAGDCAALPLRQKLVPRQGGMYPVWLPEAAAHVPHCVPRDDQQDPLSR